MNETTSSRVRTMLALFVGLLFVALFAIIDDPAGAAIGKQSAIVRAPAERAARTGQSAVYVHLADGRDVIAAMPRTWALAARSGDVVTVEESRSLLLRRPLFRIVAPAGNDRRLAAPDDATQR